MRKNENLPLEAQVFCQYLTGRDALPEIVDRYTTIIRTTPGQKVSEHDKKLMLALLSHPSLIPFIDGGLALHNPRSEIRRRIYTLFAILESSPEYAPNFLPQSRSLFYILVIILLGVKTILHSVLGFILVRGVLR